MSIKGEMFFYVLLCITAFGVEITLSQNSTHKFAPLRQMIVTDDKILIGGVGGIAVLKKENMTERQNNSLYSKNWLLLFDGKRDEIIQCNENLNNISSCSKLQAGTLFESVKSQNMTVDLQNIPTYSMVNVTEVNTNIVIIGANIVKFRNISYGILSFNLTDFNLFQTEFFWKGANEYRTC